ncbi:uncharacterized protein M421DRAFT_424416 [Didymella exigua CBS 183.55]|uniref:Uncharacterized protein n=1 Tax=Didymella exigua CBS 183.55 TaxID=1150837 RepID=A0A6A5RBQ2_9PLEO|nr:uncharacterized protein M421DRAFT_424416 [Didymella exigua CBS 183.55]KAF1924779.1 hypothetical protein M421DRAFT_424416 [Didymella exigua CBS 183.55]
MEAQQQFVRLGLDEALDLREEHHDHDEELPDYNASSAAPAYDDGDHDGPYQTFHLRRYDRRIQMLVAYGSSANTAYRITTNTFRLFSKRPEMEVLYTDEGRMRTLAAISFDDDGPLPWRPRAHFKHTDADGVAERYNMESRNFVDWTVTLGDTVYEWRLSMWPISLELSQKHSSLVIARFTYSDRGTLAVRGGEVGDLAVYRDGLTLQRDGVGKVVCSVMVALTQLQKLGRHYHNDDATRSRTNSTAREQPAAHRRSSAGFSVV